VSRLALAALCLVAAGAAQAAPVPSSTRCTGDAQQQAHRLLAFHLGEDDPRIVIDPDIKALPSVANPANPKQRFDVLEVMGNVYKGEYRMRLLYYPLAGSGGCVLMGQEILEHASL
jgi:hypothetical protein